MDEAFHPLSAIIGGTAPAVGELYDDEAGVSSRIERFEVESPVELDVTRDGRELRIGSTPPLYYVDTSLRPSYHRLRFTAERTRGSDDS